MGSSDLQVRGRNLQIRPEGVENGNPASMSSPFAIESADVYSAPTRTGCTFSDRAKSVWSEFGLNSRQSRYIDEGRELRSSLYELSVRDRAR